MTRLIDADKLKKRIDEVFANDELEFKDLIDNAPTVAVDNYCLGYQDGLKKGAERQNGDWIDEVVPVGLVGRGNRQCRCSLCGHGDIQAKTQEVPYCWFCGAKMNEKHIADK